MEPLADFENGLARLGSGRVVHLIDPNPGAFDVYCHSMSARRTSTLMPANEATGPGCYKCIGKAMENDPSSLDSYESKEIDRMCDLW